MPQPHGGFLVAGAGGGPQPGSGRTPDEFKKLCQELACAGAKVAPSVLKNPKHPAYLGALKWATEHGYGKPKETHDVKLSGSVQVAFTRETRKKTAS
jgi:hypothetical protein